MSNQQNDIINEAIMDGHLTNYRLKEKVNGWEYKTSAESISGAVENLFMHLKAYKFTRAKIRSLLEVAK